MGSDTDNTRNYAILVDQSAMNENWSLDFVRARAKDPLCRLILLVDYPDTMDYDSYQWAGVEFDVIVRNSGLKRTPEFKIHALSIIKDASDYNIVAAVETTRIMREVYFNDGVPFVFDEKGSLHQH